MTQIFVPRKYDVLEKQSFTVVADILMGTIVEFTSAGKVQAATAKDKAIGIVDNMPEYRAINATGTVSAADKAQVALFGVSFNGVAGGTFSAGDYLLVSSGLLTGTTAVSEFIALEASTASGQSVVYVKN